VKHTLTRSVALLAILLMTAFSITPAAQIPGINRGKDKDDAKLRESQKAKAEKETRRYDKLKTFSLNLYQTDADFRDDVDADFDNVQRDHSIEAFQRNVSPPARPTVVHDGDRLRLQQGLYDNKMVADYVNHVGQQLVPTDSEKLFAFRLVADPTPFAYTLSTGTLYVSTGLMSLLDNEAQLAFVLAHEMAHVQLDHWRLKSVLKFGEEEYNKKEATRRKLIGTGIGALAGALTGKAAGGDAQAVVGSGVLGAGIGYAVGSMWASALTLDWDTVQENEADGVAFKAALSRSYDVREVPKLYASLQAAVKQDQRVGLGFMGSKRRTAERTANAEDAIKELKTFRGCTAGEAGVDQSGVRPRHVDAEARQRHSRLLPRHVSAGEEQPRVRAEQPAERSRGALLLREGDEARRTYRRRSKACRRGIPAGDSIRRPRAQLRRVFLPGVVADGSAQSEHECGDRQIAAVVSDGVDAVRVRRSVAGQRAAGESRRSVRLSD